MKGTAKESGTSAHKPVAVVVDSAASLPAGVVDKAAFHVVPMRLNIGGKTYLDGVDLSPTDFYRRQRGLKEPPVTSAPSPAAFLEAFRDASATSSAILCATVSPRFSSSYDSARTAAMEAAEELPDTEISVIDTESAAGGEGLVALAACRAAVRGAGLAEAVSTAQAVIQRVSLLAFLDTLYFVWKGGRVRGLAYASTSILRIKPIFELRRGDVDNIARPRTVRRATDKLIRLLRERAGHGRMHAAVMHGDSPELADGIRREIESGFECEEVYVSEFSPVMGAHTGPGLLGVAFWTEPP